MGTLGGQGGPPRSPKGTRGVPEPQKWSPRHPQTPQIEPKRSPQTPKWCPGDPPSSQNEAQKTPRQAPELCARRFHDRKNIQTDAKTTNQQAARQTTEIRRPGGMREAIEYGGPPAGLGRVGPGASSAIGYGLVRLVAIG